MLNTRYKEFGRLGSVVSKIILHVVCDISKELAENVIIDLDKNGCIIGIEVLDASKNLGKELGAFDIKQLTILFGCMRCVYVSPKRL